jgi:glycosyltransferase involved in cell wall biosynthesis
MPLSDISILITTFLRDGALATCIQRIKDTLPECPIIVTDDGYPADWKNSLKGVTYIQLPFDSGLPAKRNAGVQACKTKYLLMGCDDFDFGCAEARQGVVKLYALMENYPDADVAGGRHENQPYEGFLTYVPGEYIKETRLKPSFVNTVTGTAQCYRVDLTVNYFLMRVATTRGIPWDERMKIGGEHGDWFLELKLQKKNVVWVPGVNINALRRYNQGNNWPKDHPDYGRYRNRAVELGHVIFLEKRSIGAYYGFGDIVSIQHRALQPEPMPSGRVFIALMACHRYESRVIQARQSWIQDLDGADYKFFFGRPAIVRDPKEDEIFLDVDDGYNSLPLKVQAACKYMAANGYDFMFKADDDTYIVPDRLLHSGFAAYDYVGRLRGPADWKTKGDKPADYPSGGPGYWLSRRAAEIVASATWDGDWAEDRWVANVLLPRGIKIEHDGRYWLWPWRHGGQTDNPADFITACNIEAKPGYTMAEMHSIYKQTGKLPYTAGYQIPGARR